MFHFTVNSDPPCRALPCRIFDSVANRFEICCLSIEESADRAERAQDDWGRNVTKNENSRGNSIWGIYAFKYRRGKRTEEKGNFDFVG